MNRDEIFALVKNIFVDTFKVDAPSITDATSSDDLENWDSLNHVILIVDIEKKFKIKFPLGEMPNLNSIRKIIDSIVEKIDKT